MRQSYLQLGLHLSRGTAFLQICMSARGRLRSACYPHSLSSLRCPPEDALKPWLPTKDGSLIYASRTRCGPAHMIYTHAEWLESKVEWYIRKYTIFTLSIRTPHHTCSKIWPSTNYYPALSLKTAGWVPNSVVPDAAFCGVSSWSTLFARTCLSEYIR